MRKCKGQPEEIHVTISGKRSTKVPIFVLTDVSRLTLTTNHVGEGKYGAPFENPFDDLTVPSNVEALRVLREAEGEPVPYGRRRQVL